MSIFRIKFNYDTFKEFLFDLTFSRLYFPALTILYFIGAGFTKGQMELYDRFMYFFVCSFIVLAFGIYRLDLIKEFRKKLGKKKVLKWKEDTKSWAIIYLSVMIFSFVGAITTKLITTYIA